MKIDKSPKKIKWTEREIMRTTLNGQNPCLGMDFLEKKKKGRETINGPDLEEVPSESVVTWHLADRSQEKPGFDLPSMGS